ncbi:PspC domain-containing protein [Clostridium perfringens]|uniref:PspC domain-containing protein n=1 Tax=Clostridium perfringens TaxID=1502 RepID=UPI002AC55933|nr:PspC domain-containing protein [Clostridium perfringens]MDZ5016632.1 PspC domain-containing protein [Clostridium perfringens]
MNKKLYKISAQKRVAGVCAGFAEYINADVTLIRVLALLIILCSFSIGLIFYLGCALIMPDKPEIM